MENQFNDLIIADQIWTDRNLMVTKFQNGDSIPQALNPEDFRLMTVAKKPAFAYFEYDENNKEFGCCYNWYALNDKRIIVPKGYRLPTKDDASNLLDYFIGKNRLDFEAVKVQELKDHFWNLNQRLANALKSNSGWKDKFHDYSKSDQYNLDLGFNMLALGVISTATRYEFGWKAVSSSFWLADKDPKYRWLFVLQHFNVGINRVPYKDCESGHFVRLVKGIEENSIELILGEKIWMKNNLNVDSFQNGDKMFEANSDLEWEDAIKSKIPAYRHIRDKFSNDTEYGKLYNCYAVQDERGLAPAGWRIPTKEDILYTIEFQKNDGFDYQKHFDSKSTIMKGLIAKLVSKDSGTGTNSSGLGLNYYPMLNGYKGFTPKVEYGKMWLSPNDWIDSNIFNYTVDLFSPIFERESVENKKGFTIRCVKDK